MKGIAMIIPSAEDMLKAGVHYGHHVSRWHPKMEKFIFGKRNDIHIINVEETQKQLEKVNVFIKSILEKNGTILFLSTKTQAQETLKKEAERAKMPYVNQKWLGGFITNFRIVSKLIKNYKELIKKRDSGDLKKYTKKEQLGFEKEINRLYSLIGGVLEIEKVPDALFVWDCKKEKTALK